MPTFNPNANPSLFNLDIPSGLQPDTGRKINPYIGTIGTYGAPITNPAASNYLTSISGLPHRGLAAGGSPLGGTTKYTLNGIPIGGNEIAGALKAIQTGTPQGSGVTTFDPAAAFNQQRPGMLPGLSTAGVNPYLNDRLMSSYYGLDNPMYQQPQDFYGDPELFRAPSVAGSIP